MTNPKEAGGFSGMLIDLDLAVRVDKAGKDEQTEAHAMTGTLEFIAIELLEATLTTETRRLEHTYRHDLESFFYVFLSVCVRYGWEKVKAPKEHPLSAWYTGKLENIAMAKSGNMESRQFEKYILTKFSPTFDRLKDLARILRDFLFHKGILYTSTPEEPRPLYDSMVKAFDDTIRALDW